MFCLGRAVIKDRPVLSETFSMVMELVDMDFHRVTFKQVNSFYWKLFRLMLKNPGSLGFVTILNKEVFLYNRSSPLFT